MEESLRNGLIIGGVFSIGCIGYCVGRLIRNYEYKRYTSRNFKPTQVGGSALVKPQPLVVAEVGLEYTDGRVALKTLNTSKRQIKPIYLGDTITVNPYFVQVPNLNTSNMNKV